AYVCHDFEDAVQVGIVSPDDLPELVRERCGDTRREQLGSFIRAVIEVASATGTIGMAPAMAEALAAFRRFNYDRIYMRSESVAQAQLVIRVLRQLVEYYADQPGPLPLEGAGHRLPVDHSPGSSDSLRAAVTYVGGMTDRFAFTQA